VKYKPQISIHSEGDWCHLCGVRGPQTLDISYADNAEHPVKHQAKYVRICGGCVKQMLRTFLEAEPFDPKEHRQRLGRNAIATLMNLRQ